MKKLLIVMVLGASAVAASAQGLQPRRTLGSRLARLAQTASQTVDAARDREARAAQRSQFSASSLTAEFDRECDAMFMDIVREAEICQTNLAEYATYPYWPDAMGVVSNFCEKENCVVVDVGHHFGSWKQGSWWQGCGKKAYVAHCNLETRKRFVPQGCLVSVKDGFRVISRGGSYTNVAYCNVGSICCYDSDGRFVELYDSLDKIPGMKQCFDNELKVNYGKQDQWMKAHGFGEEGSGREAENRLDAARTNVIGRLNSLRTILSTFPQWQSDNKWHRVCDVGAGMGGPSAYGELSRSRPLLGGLRRPGFKPSINIDTNDEVLVRVNERFECLGRKQDKLIETVVRDLTGLEFGVSANTNGMLDLKFNLGSYETCTFGTNQGDVNSVTLIAGFEPSCEQKTIHEKLDMSLSTLLSAIGMDRNALAYEVSLNGARPLVGLLRPAGDQDWKSVQSFSRRFTISRNKQQSGQYAVTISDQKKVAAPIATDNARRSGLLGGGTLRARRLQRQQEAEAAAAKQREKQAAKDAERQAQAELERKQRAAERAEQRQQLLKVQEELKRVKEAKAAAAKNECAASCITNKLTSEKGIVAEKLGQCDFLLNKDFKTNAKVYLCLFSASWCGPCRAEMPRIAKTYAETLKDDPDIELIHFSRDQNDEKAMAWAKEHDVKFPVVKPKGGNPLDLHCNGIPHLFIVKADGTLVEEGHPMNIFNEEKFREIKGASTTGAREPDADTCDVVSSNDMTGPYGIRMQPDPGCEKGALYVLKRLKDVYLPAAVRYYGDPFVGQKPTRVFTLHVKRNDGTGDRKYTGVSWGSCGDGIDSFTIGLAKGSDKWEMDLPLVASKVLTVCSESDSAAFSIYANDFVRGEVGHYDPISKIKEDIREGLRLRNEAEDNVKGRPWVLRKLAPTWAAFEELREKHPTLVLDYCNLKNSKYAKGELPQKISADQMEALMGEVTGVDAVAIFKKHSAAGVSSTPQGKIAVAEKLGQCDFLLNKDFKKNAKLYLCLFSASWCGPCRAEMPRIAKTYAETLKNDPDIELIHFSRDQNDEKAMAWAKEHDVKFPVVKPKGGNPLDLHSRGIPHLFIVKADGTLVEEGHPMRIFNEEKFREIKGGDSIGSPAPRVRKTDATGDDGSRSACRGVVAQKLQCCDFFLNKDFKKNAKYYLYLLSDYWRPEMPRIAKTYAEMLKDDPGIELIHVLYGRDYEKALAWAKEHDVKFPIVKDNPLRLYWRTSGDYMFIVNADGSVLKEGQPKTLFTEEKLRRLKNGEPLSNAATINGVKWTYEIVDDAIVLGEGTSRGGLAVPKNTVGDITIPETIDGNPVRGIGEYAFAGCSGLTSITIPSSVTKIANTAFEGCRGLTSISIPSSVRKIDAGVFNGCANLTSISVSAENEQYASCGGVLFDKSMQTLVCYPCGIRGVYAIPEGVMCIGRSAFSAWESRCSGLSGVKIPDSVKSIGDYSFDFCKSLKEVILGNGVTTIGSCAFRCCDGLTSIKIPENVVNIDHYAFGACRSLASVTMCGERPKADTGVFKDCKKLTAIHVPANCKSWAGMKEWQGIPLVFDAETKK